MIKKKYAIAIIEAHRSVAEAIGCIINMQSDMNYCGYAAAINDGLKLIHKCRPDLVLVNISLKNNELGTTCIHEIRKYSADIKILVYTMHDNILYLDAAIKEGANGYILKEESLEDLLSALRKVLKGGSYISNSLTQRYGEWKFSQFRKDNKNVVNILAPREMEIFLYIGDGISSSEIAAILKLSVNTVNSYISRIKDKLGLKTKNELLKYAFNHSKNINN